MKKIAFQISQIFALLIILNSPVIAQDNFPQLRNRLDNLFNNLNKSEISSGILEENSFGFMNLSQINTEV
jgi:hypothetical protein